MHKVEKKNKYDSFSDDESYEKEFYSFQEANSYHQDEIPIERRSDYRVKRMRSPWDEDTEW